MQNTNSPHVVIAFVGMPGSGKSEAASYLKQKGLPYVRFGQVTEDGLAALRLAVTPDNEKMYREKLRKELGMAAYAIKSWQKITSFGENESVVVVDGLYSWEEYLYLQERLQKLLLVYVFASPSVRYKRLSERTIRPLSADKAYERDVAEVNNLNKGGPIAMADFVIENNGEDLGVLHEKIEKILKAILAKETI